MDPLTVGIISLPALLIFIALRVPIALSLALVSGVGIWIIVGSQAAFSILSSVPYSFAASWTLSSVPMFLLMGYLAFHAGMTRGLFQAARAWLGWLPGGLAIASLFGAGGFAAVTGSSVACAAAMGRIAIPEMLKSNYDPRIAAGVVAAGGTVGALIPPSILLIIYGIQAEVSISKLFLGGFFVGSLSILFYILTVLGIAIFSPDKLPRGLYISKEERYASLREIWPVLLLIVTVFGGMAMGIFTATEAGAIGVLMTFSIGILRRTLRVGELLESCADTLLASGSLFLIAAGANMYTRLIALSNLPFSLELWINDMGLTATGLLLLICLIYLLLGMFLDPIGAMLLTLPLFLPLITGMGIDEIWFGLLLAKMLEIGMITPPVGMNVFVIHSVVGDRIPLSYIFRGIVPFLIADLIFVAGMLFFYD